MKRLSGGSLELAPAVVFLHPDEHDSASWLLRPFAIAARAVSLLGFVLVVGCGDSTGPGNVDGRYTFHWAIFAGQPCCIDDFAAMSDGAVTFATANGETTTTFQVPGWNSGPEPASLVDGEWLTLALAPGGYSLVLHWTPDGSCTGQVNRNLTDHWMGTCTLVKQ
jgi:hypothetical protein